VPQGGHGALDHLLVFLRRALGFIDEFPRDVETMGGKKIVGFGGVKVGHGLPVD
jgi:hypothetical protein